MWNALPCETKSISAGKPRNSKPTTSFVYDSTPPIFVKTHLVEENGNTEALPQHSISPTCPLSAQWVLFSHHLLFSLPPSLVSPWVETTLTDRRNFLDMQCTLSHHESACPHNPLIARDALSCRSHRQQPDSRHCRT